MSDRDEELRRDDPPPPDQDPTPSAPAIIDPRADADEPPAAVAVPPPAADGPRSGEEATPDSDGAEERPYDRMFGVDDVRRHSAATEVTTTEASDGSADDEATADAGDNEAVASDEEDLAEEPRRPRIAVLIGGLLLLVLVGGGIGLFASGWRLAIGNTETIARVGQTDITRAEFTRSWSDGQDAQAVLDQLIDFELVVQAARNEGATVDTAAIDQQVQELKAQHGNDNAQFETFLQQNNIPSEANLRLLMERQQLVEAMVLKHTTVEQARASHILLTGDSPEAIAGRKAEAEELLKQLEGGADFSTLAQEKSEDPGSKANGGDLGWAPRGVFVPAFDEAVFSMKPGELRLVQSDFGWHIIKLQNAAEVRGLENQDYFQTPPVMEAFNSTFLPWVKGLRAAAEEKGEVQVLVQPTELVPTAGPAAPPLPGAPAP